MEVAVEIHFAQQLASNQKIVRDRALKKVGKWLGSKSASVDAFDEQGMMKIWKGLFYYFWNCDKPLVQENAADFISNFIHVFKNSEYTFLFIDTFFQTMGAEWFSIDRYRIEKFMMFVRRFLHHCFEFLKSQKWDLKAITNFKQVMKKTVMNPQCETFPLGLKTHITDIYMEVLAKVGSQELTPQLMQKFIVPYCHVLIQSDNPIFLKSVKKDIFLYLVNQDADEEEFNDFPVLQFDASSIQKLLMKFANKPSVSTKHIKIIHDIVKRFQDYKDGLDVNDKNFKNQSRGPKLKKSVIEKAALNLLEEDRAFASERTSFKIKGKKQKIIDL